MSIKSISISLLITAFVGYFILFPPSAFNFIPYAIHEEFLRNTSIKEHHFIIGFDLVILIVLFFGVNKLLNRRM